MKKMRKFLMEGSNDLKTFPSARIRVLIKKRNISKNDKVITTNLDQQIYNSLNCQKHTKILF